MESPVLAKYLLENIMAYCWIAWRGAAFEYQWPPNLITLVGCITNSQVLMLSIIIYYFYFNIRYYCLFLLFIIYCVIYLFFIRSVKRNSSVLGFNHSHHSLTTCYFYFYWDERTASSAHATNHSTSECLATSNAHTTPQCSQLISW